MPQHSRRDAVRDQTKFTYHRVTFVAGKISMRGEHGVHGARARTKQNRSQEGRGGTRGEKHRDGALAPPARLSNQSATNEQHELACKTTRPGVPGPRRVVIPHRRAGSKSMDRSTLVLRTSPRIRARGIPPRGSTPTQSRETQTRTNCVYVCVCVCGERGYRKRKEHRVVCVRVYVRGMRRTRSSVTEGTIKRYFRRGNSRYLKLRSQISNAENRC